MPTSARFFLLLTLLIVVIILVISPVAANGVQPALRSEHSQPAARIPNQQVAIVKDGKLFHDPKCSYKHGTAQLVSAVDAVNMGYTPCPRCMRKALAK